jgi:predicted ABC-type ATPase
MVAGPNGAGKTTLTSYLRARDIDFGEYINPDDIALELVGSYEDRVNAAQKVADRLRDSCIKNLRSFSFETVMSHPSKLEVLARAKAAGFSTTLYFVGTDDPRINIYRVAARVKRGGHNVPNDRIVARWQRTMENLRPAMKIADNAFIFDNSSAEKGPRLILQTGLDSKRRMSSSAMPDWVTRFALPI